MPSVGESGPLYETDELLKEFTDLVSPHRKRTSAQIKDLFSSRMKLSAMIVWARKSREQELDEKKLPPKEKVHRFFREKFLEGDLQELLWHWDLRVREQMEGSSITDFEQIVQDLESRLRALTLIHDSLVSGDILQLPPEVQAEWRMIEDDPAKHEGMIRALAQKIGRIKQIDLVVMRIKLKQKEEEVAEDEHPMDQ